MMGEEGEVEAEADLCMASITMGSTGMTGSSPFPHVLQRCSRN